MSNEISTSEEDLERFEEALDKSFLTENLYKSHASEKTFRNKDKLPSLRNQPVKPGSVNPFFIKVSPEYQSYVSKHLAKILDDSVYYSEKPLINKITMKKPCNCTIKLLNESKNYISLEKTDLIKKPVYKKTNNFKYFDYEKRAKEVAVSGEWVLSQKETEHWVPNTKGKLEVIQIENHKGKDYMQKVNRSKGRKKKRNQKGV